MRVLILALALAAVFAVRGEGEAKTALSEMRRGTVIYCDWHHRVFQLMDDDRISQRYTWDYGRHGPEQGDVIEAQGVPREGSPGMYDHAIYRVVWRPWWNTERIVIVGAIAVGVAFASLLWALFLRRLVRLRTAALVRESSARMRAEIEADAVARERLRLSYDLHDDLQQLLAGTMARLKAGLNYLGRHDEMKAISQFAFARQSVSQTQLSLRHILWGLHDESSSDGSVLGLFTYVAKRHPEWKDVVTFAAEGEERPVSHQVSGALLMIMQEAVGNALRHGEAAKIAVKLGFSPKGIALTVADDGSGFDIESARGDPSRLGLVSMRLRAEQLGGKFTVSSVKGEGTTIRVAVPDRKEDL